MASPTVSVIIPTYNRISYLRQAVDSVLTQTYRDLELLVVDDGSSDDTADAMASIDDPRLCYVYQDNAGRSVARNHGIEEARGDYVAFLDDDDLYLPSRLEMQVASLDAQPDVHLVASGAILIDAQGNSIGAWHPWEQNPDITLDACLFSCPLLPSIVLLRRSALGRLDHYFDPQMDRAEDTDFFLRLLVSGCRMAWVKQDLVGYRQHMGSSQRDAAGYYLGQSRLYDKLFANERFPAELLGLRSQVAVKPHIDAVARYYMAGECESANLHLQEAARLMPEWYQEGILLEQVLRFAENPLVWLDPTEHRTRVLECLPPDVVRSQAVRRAEARVAMATLFSAAAVQDWATVCHHWWKGVSNDPRWLANWGIWSLGVRALVSAERRQRHKVPQVVGGTYQPQDDGRADDS